MIFLTTGTEYPFDRLIKTVDEAVRDGSVFDEVFAQIGRGSYQPKNMQWVEMLSRDDFERYIQESVAVISHAGMGTIIRCLELRKPLLMIPRRSVLGEHVNDHQVSTARKFTGRKDLLVVYEIEDLVDGIGRLENLKPSASSPQANRLVTYLEEYLAHLNEEKTGRSKS
jgi:UDP-N-acetylglucosamine transferase subunit ALG13